MDGQQQLNEAVQRLRAEAAKLDRLIKGILADQLAATEAAAMEVYDAQQVLNGLLTGLADDLDVPYGVSI